MQLQLIAPLLLAGIVSSASVPAEDTSPAPAPSAPQWVSRANDSTVPAPPEPRRPGVMRAGIALTVAGGAMTILNGILLADASGGDCISKEWVYRGDPGSSDDYRCMPQGLWSMGGLAVGVILLGVGIPLWAVNARPASPDERPAERPAAQLFVSPRSASIRWSF